MGRINAASFFGVNTACIMTITGDLELTHDGGATWDKLTGEANGGFWTISFVDDLNGWAVTGEATGKAKLVRTLDGGKTWRKMLTCRSSRNSINAKSPRWR
jgi:photosystem II stability/assembly factor-like uncharacterized protein